MSNLNELLRQVYDLRQQVLKLHGDMQAIPGPDKYKLCPDLSNLARAATVIERCGRAAQGNTTALNTLWNSTSTVEEYLDSCLTDGQMLYELKPEARAYFEAAQRIRRRLPDVADSLDKAAAALGKLGATVAEAA